MYESFASVWELVADAIPDAPAVVQGDRRVIYGELEDRGARLARALAADAASAATRTSRCSCYNCPEYMECLFACSKLRAVPANVNFRYLGAELAFLVENADAEVLVYHRSLAERVAGARDHMPGIRRFIEIDDEPSAETSARSIHTRRSTTRSRTSSSSATHEPQPRIERSGDDFLLWYTGGTTGLPKGVLWHQGTLLGYGLIAAYALQNEPVADSVPQLIDDVRRWRARGTPLISLLTTPLVHATAVHQANTAFAVGGTIVLLERGHIDGDVVCATIERERPSVLEIVGDVLMRRVAQTLAAAEARAEPYDLSSLQRIHNSGAMVERAAQGRAAIARHDAHLRLAGLERSGRVRRRAHDRAGPERDRTLQARTERTRARRRRPRRRARLGRGRAYSRCGSSCAVGYYKDPERSAMTFRTIDGVLHAMPGDYATVEVDGTLTLLGRGSNCINSGGEKVWPEEVEEVLKEHPAVIDAVVMGVPDDEWGEIVAAVVATTGDGPTSADALGDWVGARLAGYKRPRRIVFTDEVGRTTVGKLDYEWARRVLEEAPAADHQ